MEGVLVADSSVNRVWPLPLTKEAVMSLKDDLVTFPYVRSFFDVDLPTFKAKLFEFNILVWKNADGLPIRIHGDRDKIPMVINRIRSFFTVEGFDPFYVVRNKIESSYGLTHGSYRLTYEQPQTSEYKLLETDLDWHYAVECSKERGLVRLTLEADDDHIVTTIMNGYEGLFASDEECDDTPYDGFACSHPVIKVSPQILSPSEKEKLFASIDRTIADKLIKDAAIGEGKNRVGFDGAQLPVKKAKTTMAAYDEYCYYDSDFHESDYDDSY